jgi:hypothetical protein
MSVKIPVKAGIAVKIRSVMNADYPQSYKISRIIDHDQPYQTIILLGTYSGGESVTLDAQATYHELDVQCQFFHENLQYSKELFKATNQESLWTIFADDSHDDFDYNDLIVQLDLGNNFEGIAGLIAVDKPKKKGSGGGLK